MGISPHEPSADENRPSAHRAIRGIGTNAMPYLLQWLATPPYESDLKERIRDILGDSDFLGKHMPDFVWSWANEVRNSGRYESSPEAISALGFEAAFAIPYLRELRDKHLSSKVRWKATLALAGLSADEISPLVEAISHGEDSKFDEHWIDANWAFVNYPTLRTNIAPVLPALIDRLRRGNSTAVQTLRVSALDCGQSHSILPALTNLLADPDASVRARVGEVIEEIAQGLQDRE